MKSAVAAVNSRRLNKINRIFNALAVDSLFLPLLVLILMTVSIYYISTKNYVYKYTSAVGKVKTIADGQITIKIKLDPKYLTDIGDSVDVMWNDEDSDERFEAKMNLNKKDGCFYMPISKSDGTAFNIADNLIKEHKKIVVEIPYKKVALWHRFLEFIHLDE